MFRFPQESLPPAPPNLKYRILNNIESTYFIPKRLILSQNDLNCLTLIVLLMPRKTKNTVSPFRCVPVSMVLMAYE